MGESAKGFVCYGMPVTEDSTLPWCEGDGDNDIEEWWRNIHGYQPPFELFDAEGNWIDGKQASKEQTSEYFEHQKAWHAKNPLPIELVNYQSHDYPLWIIAIPGRTQEAYYGDPQPLVTSDPIVSPGEYAALMDFITKYEIEGGQIGWYLGAFYG